jgi:tRNA-dihydrouridine synthase B
MQIGPLTVHNPFFLAPLAGYTDLPFRILCHELGAGLVFSEMISCHGLVFQQKKTLAMLATVAKERPVAFQLFGNDPEIMGEAAAFLSNYPIDCIDINMGCPVRKVVRKGSGAALMKDVQMAEAIIKAVVHNTHLPVTVKFRSGWNSDSIIADTFALMAENAGASAVIVHARTWSQAFGGKADWSIISKVKQAVTIPVIGNGYILSYQDGERMMLETGCDGVMIGRGALGNPWVFQKSGRPDSVEQRCPVITRHIELIKKYLPERQLLFKIRNHVVRYLVGHPGASQLRYQISNSTTIDEIINLINESIYPPETESIF